jgi:serine/threonine-protein kinase
MIDVKRAVMLAPGLAEAHFLVGRLLLEAGQLEEGIRRLETVLGLDPHLRFARGDLIRGYALLGRWDRAREQVEKLEKLDGAAAYLSRARLMLWTRDVVEADKLIDAIGNAPGRPGALRAMARLIRYGEDPTKDPAVKGFLNAALTSGRRSSFIRQLQTETLVVMGDKAGALETLAQALESGLFDIAWLDGCPLFEPLRADPVFQALRREVATRARAILEAARQ